ncbi:MAG: hypothetical protein ACJAQR_001968 [Bacteroidia bacterium]|jgi:hypothetical protein
MILYGCKNPVIFLHLPIVYYILFLATIGYLIYGVRKPKRRPLRAFDEQ